MLLTLHTPLIQSNAWHVALPQLRSALSYCLDSLVAVSTQRPDILCATAAAVASAAELSGVIAIRGVVCYEQHLQ
jgi:hypothetical protein